MSHLYSKKLFINNKNKNNTGRKLYIASQQVSVAEMRQKRNTKNGVTCPVFNVGLWPPYFGPHDRKTDESLWQSAK